jgi:hypothetical protein
MECHALRRLRLEVAPEPRRLCHDVVLAEDQSAQSEERSI